MAGGSSGGSAVAVAAGLCFATVDTDAVGSGRLPAAVCGVTCLKPTYGVLSTAGILAGEPDPGPAIQWLSHPCVTARSAADVALAFEALVRPLAGAALPAHDAARDLAPRRPIGIVTNFAADDAVRAAFEAAVAKLAAVAAGVREVRVPFEAASFDVSGIARDRAAIGASLFGDLDALVLPTLCAPAPTVTEARVRGALAVSPDNTFFCNYYGLPAATVPSGADADGLPLGVQIVGPPGGDGRVLATAQAYQRATGWRYAPPRGADVEPALGCSDLDTRVPQADTARRGRRS